MSDWTDGYIPGVDYVFGYYGELSPLRLAIPFLNVGLAPPPVATACELGYGQGLSINAHAAASDARWWGTDFNPAHAAFARELAEAAGSDAQLFDQSFAEFATRADLPEFDYIGLHGVWSWISDENRRVIVDFIGRKLKPGGVLYISYNTQPGHAATLPFRHLLHLHTERMQAPGRGVPPRIDAALDFADTLMALGPGFANANPSIAARLKGMREQSRQYLAHEYFNQHWVASLFAEVAESLSAAKLSFACSAHFLDHIDALNMTPDLQRFLAGLPDPEFRQSVRDFIVNQQFRRDYWVKGARRLSPLEQAEAIRGLRVIVPAASHGEIALTASGPLGAIGLNPEIYQPVLDAIGEFEPATVGEIEARLQGRNMSLSTLYEAVMVLGGKGDLMAAQDAATQERVRPRTERHNRFLLDKARGGGDLPILASPVTGTGIRVSRANQLFLLAQTQGRSNPDDLARAAWQVIGAQGRGLVKDGRRLETAEENLDELERQAREFRDRLLPGLRALQVA
ncbi:MAG TPA: class I SAM-dependent methyltransferase [Stellaceae bacterium]|nr:class I SAM-dependent methyltransferase [Stellaceae bacterium]